MVQLQKQNYAESNITANFISQLIQEAMDEFL